MLEVALYRISLLHQRIGYLLSHGVNQDLLFPQGLMLVQPLGCMLDDIGIEAPAKAGIGREYHKSYPLHLPGHGVARLHIAPTQEVGEQAVQTALVRQHVGDSPLRLVELGRGYHLHGRRNFPRVVHGGYASFDFFQ